MIETIEDVRALEAEADRLHTPCGDGEMVWRCWSKAASQSGSATASKRPPVVLLHGGSGSWTHWVHTIARLKDDYELWAPDLPGLGDSAMPAQPFVPEQCAAALADGLVQLIPAMRRPQLVGFSFGAHVGSFAAVLLGGHLSSFTIIGSSALGLQRPQLDDFPREHPSMDAAARREVHRRVLEILMLSKPERISELAITLQEENVGKARFRSRKFAPTDNVRRALANVSVPLRSIWGRNDVIAHPSVEACLEVLREHHTELISEIIPDSGHWVMFEQPDAFAAALRRILAA